MAAIQHLLAFSKWYKNQNFRNHLVFVLLRTHLQILFILGDYLTVLTYQPSKLRIQFDMKFVFSLYRLKLTQVQRTPTKFGRPVLTHIRKMSCNFWLSDTFSSKRLTLFVG